MSLFPKHQLIEYRACPHPQKPLHLLHYRHLPIQEQLALEETLLRSSVDNWFILNEGTPVAIVMGISGKVDELVEVSKTTSDNIPILRRFSGGGTVIVDEHTLFATWICQKKLFSFPAFPEPIMRWTATMYQEAFDHPLFQLRENDFVIGEKKIGGNAQYIKKDRWLQHTSFLWDYQPERMQYLKHPPKTPPYRQGRSHEDFLSRLSTHYDCKDRVVAQLKDTAARRWPIVN